MSDLPNRKATRLKEYDYSSPGTYFVTVCTKDRKNILSNISVGQGLAPAENKLTKYGKLLDKQISVLEKRYETIKIDHYVIMPNHIHVTLLFQYRKNWEEQAPPLRCLM